MKRLPYFVIVISMLIIGCKGCSGGGQGSREAISKLMLERLRANDTEGIVSLMFSKDMMREMLEFSDLPEEKKQKELASLDFDWERMERRLRHKVPFTHTTLANDFGLNWENAAYVRYDSYSLLMDGLMGTAIDVYMESEGKEYIFNFVAYLWEDQWWLMDVLRWGKFDRALLPSQ